jgi:hypothetical protein
MGWAGGSNVANELWDALAPLIHRSQHQGAARKIVDILESEDWDTQCESEPLMEAAYGPEWELR